MMLLPMVASANTVEIDGIYYNLSADTKKATVISGANKYTGSITIPSTVTYSGATYNVTSIDEQAFYNCSGLTSITIPNSVTSIGWRAFWGCSGLFSINIPNSVTNIARQAFSGCSGLNSVTIGSGVTAILAEVFYCCSGLTSITIPNSVKSIGDDAFYGCKGLTSITIPNSVKSIGEYAFELCSGLTSIEVESGNTAYDSRDNCNAIIETSSNTLKQGCKTTVIPNSVTIIGGSAFFRCTGLTSITIPNSVTKIGTNAFDGCSDLISVTIGSGVTDMASSAFDHCSGLTSVTIDSNTLLSWKYSKDHNFGDIFGRQVKTYIIGGNVESIGDYAFWGCSGLTSVTIGNSVKSIGEYAFAGCSSLTSVTIGNSMTSIGSSAFSFCFGLKKVIVSDIAAWCGINFPDGSSNPLNYAYHLYSDENTEITDLIIPNSVTSIGIWAFSGCSGLTSVTIPNSVTSIGEYAFYGVDIPTVISLIENPFKITGKASNSRTFSQNTFNNATLYVPKGTIDKYKATDGWKDFLFIEEGTGGGDTPTTQKCEKPTISYENGKLTFASETEGAVCQYSITDTDIKVGSGNEVQLTATYNISVYAAKSGYENSETATATLCWIDQKPATEGITDGIANIPAKALLIKNNGGQLTVEGAADGEAISVYTVNGVKSGSAISQNGAASIYTNLQAGSIAVVKIGDKSVKVVIK